MLAVMHVCGMRQLTRGVLAGSTDNTGSSGLPTWAIVVIVVAGTALLFSLLMLALCCFLLRRKTRRLTPKVQPVLLARCCVCRCQLPEMLASGGLVWHSLSPQQHASCCISWWLRNQGVAYCSPVVYPCHTATSLPQQARNYQPQLNQRGADTAQRLCMMHEAPCSSAADQPAACVAEGGEQGPQPPQAVHQPPCCPAFGGASAAASQQVTRCCCCCSRSCGCRKCPVCCCSGCSCDTSSRAASSS